MKKIVLFLALCVMPLCYAVDNNQPAEPQAKTTKQSYKKTVVLSCDLHCQGCCDKIMKNIAFEKGVKDLVCDLKTKTVTMTYDTRKTDLETLLKAFEKIGKPATVIE
ncbi:MAG: cation transporter [Paludibacteraceae bacterium]|nr:cation transporter [Paludibacteraceae bacterium]